MADLPTPSSTELHFATLAGGVLSSAPPRSLGTPGAQYIYRDSLNMLVRDGVIVGRPGIVTGVYPITQPPSPPTISGLGGSVGPLSTVEVPRYINTSVSGTAVSVVLVTDRQIYIYVNGAWVNVTPIYATGTISLTNGSTAATGTSTAWVDRGIDGAYLLIDGTTYYFTVTGNTTATITPAYAGVTGAGKAYQLRRRFGDSGFNDLFAVVYNENLYIASTRLYKGSGAISPGVLKVANIYDPAPTTTYLTADVAVDVGVDFIAGLSRIAGLTALQDGRLVFPGNQNQVFYSSNLGSGDAVWTVAPAGDTPLADVDNEIRAMGRVGATLTFHHAGGIVLGDPTNLADPPLRFQASPAVDGCIAPLTLRPYLGGEAYLAIDGDVKLFDGNQSRSLGNGELALRTKALSFAETDYHRYFAWVYPGRNEYTIFRVFENQIGTRSTKFWTYQPQLDTWWPCETTLELGAMSDAPEVVKSAGSTAKVQALVGCTSSSAAVLQVYKEDDVDATAPTYYLETDDLDHGAPTSLKTPMRVGVWPVATMTNLTVDVRTDAATSYAGGDAAMTKSPARSVATWYDFTPARTTNNAITAATAHRYKLSGATLRLGLFAMLVRAFVGGGSEQV